MEINTVENFVVHYGGEDTMVRIGIDNRSHLNIVSSYRDFLS